MHWTEMIRTTISNAPKLLHDIFSELIKAGFVVSLMAWYGECDLPELIEHPLHIDV